MALYNTRWLLPIYYGCLAIVSVRQSVYSDATGLWIIHAVGALALAVPFLFGRLLLDTTISVKFSAVSALFAFLFYATLMATTHPLVGDEFIRTIARDMILPIAFGLVLFTSKRANGWMDALGVISCIALMFVIIATIYPNLRNDIFFIRVDIQSYYQNFSTNICIMLISATHIITSNIGPWANRRRFLWFILIPALILPGIVTCQMMGSNNGTAFLAVFLVFLWAGGLWKLRSVWAFAFTSLLGVSLLFSMVTYVVVYQPPIRLLRFSDGGGWDGILHNINTRLSIMNESGWDQISYSPLFGDLAVDRIVSGAEGLYIHSIMSIQTHLGIIGSTIFLAFIIPFLARARERGVPVLISAAIPILALSLTTFFTWPMLWFAVGGMMSLWISHPKVHFPKNYKPLGSEVKSSSSI